MEHRWGQRITVNLPGRLTCPSHVVGRGRLINISASGALIAVDVALPLLASVKLEIDVQDRNGGGSPLELTGFVVRRAPGRYGLEWHELAPGTAALMAGLRKSPSQQIRRSGVGAATPPPA